MAVHDIELRFPEWRGDLVFDHPDAGLAPDYVFTILDIADPPDIDPDRGIEFQGIPAGSGLRVAEHDPDFHPDLVDKYHRGKGLADRGCEFAQGLGHKARLKANLYVSHLSFYFRTRDKCCHRVYDQNIQGSAPNQEFGNIERLFT